MGEVKGQLTLFDFINKPRSMLDNLGFKVENPVCVCVNCLCNYCANNAENRNIEPGEMVEACFDCDYCRHFSAENELCRREKENCSCFRISNYEAQKKRGKFKIAGD